MVHLFQIGHLAFSHSPTREQREVLKNHANKKAHQESAHAKERTKPEPTKRRTDLEAQKTRQKLKFLDISAGTEFGEAKTENQRMALENIQGIQAETRKKLAFLNGLAGTRFGLDEDENNAVLASFFDAHEDFVRDHLQQQKYLGNEPELLERQNWTRETFESLASDFSQEINNITRRSTKKLGPEVSTMLNHDKFVEAYYRSVRKVSKSTEVSKEQLKAFEQKNYVPNAFSASETVVFDLSHPDFNEQAMLAKLRQENPDSRTDLAKKAKELVDENQKRAVVHELSHYSLDITNDSQDVPLAQRMITALKQVCGVRKLAEHDTWRKLQSTVNAVFKNDGVGKTDTYYLHEALAIYVAGNHTPYDKTDPKRAVWKVARKLLKEIEGDPRTDGLLASLDGRLQELVIGDGKRETSYNAALWNMNAGLDERAENTTFKNEYERRDAELKKDEKEFATRTNPPGHTEHDEHQAVDGELEAAEKSTATPEQVIKTIQEANEAFEFIKETKNELLEGIPAEDRVKEEAAFAQIESRWMEESTCMVTAEDTAKKLASWKTLSKSDKNEMAQKWQFSDVGTYEVGMDQSSIIALDELNKKKRDELTDWLSKGVIAASLPITSVAKAIKNRREKKEDDVLRGAKQEEFKKEGAWAMITKRLWGPKSGVSWLTFYDAVKIYNIYKDAILDRYHSRQKIRTYDAAKEWNIWKPLQPDLDKQARAANEEEVHSFKEFLEKEKFTYNQLFDKGGVLEKNKANVNRAKAVIEYAADHAWLYHMDRFNGHNVYGIDFEGLWGARSFEELVEHNNTQQEKESSAGYSRVNNYPDINDIVPDMIEALERKNIWQVHGMMKRLQEKAKLAESNTWALATLMRAMRKDPDVLEIMDIGMLDKIGNIGIVQSAWSLTLFKVERKQILAMKTKAGAGATKEEKVALAEKSMNETGTGFHMGNVIMEIERLLPDHLKGRVNDKGHADYLDLDHEIGRVLAGQTVMGKKGKHVSIFDRSNPIFNGYREHFMDVSNTTPTDPGNTDPDFYNPQNGGSDLMLLGSAEITNNFNHKSQGEWTEPNKALNFAVQIFMRDEELGEKDPAIQASYRRDMKTKFTQYFGTNVLGQQNALNTLPKYKTGTPQGITKKIHNKIVLDEFMRREMIDPTVYRTIKAKEGNPTSPSILGAS